MRKYLIYFLTGSLIVIAGALLKILNIYEKVEYIYILGFLFETFAIINIIRIIKKDADRS